jgi:hypothetical protein
MQYISLETDYPPEIPISAGKEAEAIIGSREIRISFRVDLLQGVRDEKAFPYTFSGTHNRNCHGSSAGLLRTGTAYATGFQFVLGGIFEYIL